MSGFTFAEFFAGIGLVREALAGWRCVYANDCDPAKQRAYQARFGLDHFHLADVHDTHEVVRRISSRPTLATASFPCVDLSVAGHYRGLGGAHSSAFFGFADVLDALGERRPPLVLVENVPGFLSSRGGEDFAAAARRLAGLGYWLDAFVLDACHFVPQSRPRVFLVGTAVPAPDDPPAGWLFPPDANPLRPPAILRAKRETALETGWLTLPLPPPPRLTGSLLDVLDLDDGQRWWDDSEVRRHREMISTAHQGRIEALAACGGRWVGTIFRRIRQGTQRAEVRFDGLAGCLRTPRGGSARQIVVALDAGRLRMRWMTPREYARLQGVPDFPLVGTTTQQLWAFADAVCVPAVAWIARHVLGPAAARAVR